MLNYHTTIIKLILTLCIISSTQANNNNSTPSTQCIQTCGPTNRVPYPFGFCETCRIQLNCSDNNEITIGEYKVQNITSSLILINLPAKCNRRIEEIEPLFGPNYALTSRNALMLQNCSSPVQGCVIPAAPVETEFGLSDCGLGSDNISCYSAMDGGLELMRYDNLSRFGCRFLFSSVAVDLSNGSNMSSPVPLQFEVAELGWWLEGECNCSLDADCDHVVVGPGRGTGFRCLCREGFEGDGFAGSGGGCRRVGDCSASKYISGQCGGRVRVGVLLIGGIVAGALLVAAPVLVIYFIKRRSTSRNQMSAKRLLYNAGSSSVPLYPYKEIERATNNFSVNQRLGTGAYGTVYAGKLHNDEWVAIKKIRHRDTDGNEQVMNEIKLLSSVSHPNLVRLLGCCIENGEQILVYEFMPNGTLCQHLQRERGPGLPWTTRLTIATETARAIAYLHSVMDPPIYHRDIKSSNILLDYNFNSKVADFGLSRVGMIDDSHISTAPQGTPGYVDPQYHQNFHLSDKSDVYSFGVVLVEIITALKVVDFSRAHSDVNLAALAIKRIEKGCMDEIIDPFLEPHRDAWTISSVHKVFELAFRCLAFHRDMRPSMMEVAEELEQVRLSGWAAPEENICVSSSSVASSGSSPYNGSEKSIGGISLKKAGVGSRRLIVPQKETDCLTPLEEGNDNDSSPVCEQRSPSTNSLLGKVVR